MRYLWSRFIIIFLGIEALAFMVYYNFGPRGIQNLRDLKKVTMQVRDDIQRLEQENDDLREQIEAWKTDTFLQEKFAREKLALQKEHEIIYFR